MRSLIFVFLTALLLSGGRLSASDVDLDIIDDRFSPFEHRCTPIRAGVGDTAIWESQIKICGTMDRKTTRKHSPAVVFRFDYTAEWVFFNTATKVGGANLALTVNHKLGECNQYRCWHTESGEISLTKSDLLLCAQSGFFEIKLWGRFSKLVSLDSLDCIVVLKWIDPKIEIVIDV